MKRMEREQNADTQGLLLRLGITPNYIGYFYLADALELVMEEPKRLLLVTKLVYPKVAWRHGVSAQAVERGMRTASQKAWKTDPEYLQKLVGHRLSSRPNVSSLLAVLALELRKYKEGEDKKQ